MKLIINVVLILSLVSCAQVETKNNVINNFSQSAGVDCTFPNQQAAPNWICDEPVPGLIIQAVGVSEKSPLGIGYMKDEAIANAVGNLAVQLKVQVSKMFNSYMETAQTNKTESVNAPTSSFLKTLSKETLSDKVYKSRMGPEGRMYVLVGLTPEKTKTVVKTSIKKSMKRDVKLWTDLDTQKSLAEMAAAIAAMNVN